MHSQARFAFICLAALAACPALGAGAVPAFAQSAAPQAAPKTKPAPLPEERVDINHASAEDIAKVPGMTAVWAARIVRFRPYRSKQELLDNGVLPGEVYERIKDYVIAHRDKESASSSGRPSAEEAETRGSSDNRIDINHASLDALMKVPGMTSSLAERIVRDRPYRTKRDLLQRGIVSAAVYARIKDDIVAHRDKQ